MKRILAVFLVAFSLISFCACDGGASTTEQGNKNSQPTTSGLVSEPLNKEIVEVTITAENWDEYFEFGYTQDYYFNNLGAISHINCAVGFKLKGEHQIVLNDAGHNTRVDFEAELKPYFVDVTYDFKAGTFSVGEPTKEGKTSIETETTTFTTEVYNEISGKYPPTGVCGIGPVWQGAADGGTVQREKAYRITKVLRAEGTLYLYKK